MLKPRRAAECVLVTLAAWLTPIAAQVPQPQSPPRFRAQVILVPVDVRVVDAEGNPVTDLTAAAFTIFENGVRQDIAQFSTRSSLAASTTGRTFAIVLGRGHLNDRGKAIDALIDFVRSHLLPRDRVGVFAYLRATDLTTDHDAILRLLERYRARHDEIEDRLKGDGRRNPVGGLAGPDQPLSQGTRLAIQSLFDGPGLPATQCLPGTARELPYADFTYLMRAIELLRHVDGEKHVVFVAERGTAAGKGDFVARKAAGARVTVSLVQTGGLPEAGPIWHDPSSEDLDAARRVNDRAFVEQTGGIAAMYQAADKPLARLAKATGFQYLLGYHPAKPPQDGEYRQLRIDVKRRGVAVLYRHGYEASPQSDGEPFDVRRIFVRSRIVDAASLPPSAWVPAIPLRMRIWTPMTRLSALPMQREGGEDAVRVEIAFDPSVLAFTRNGDEYNDALDVAAFVDDAQEKRVGEKWERIDLKLGGTAVTAVKPKELLHVVIVNVTGRPAEVKVVVYEYDTDHLKVATLRPR